MLIIQLCTIIVLHWLSSKVIGHELWQRLASAGGRIVLFGPPPLKLLITDSYFYIRSRRRGADLTILSTRKSNSAASVAEFTTARFNL